MLSDMEPYRGTVHRGDGASENFDPANLQFITPEMRWAAITREAARTMALLAQLAQVPHPEPSES